jgi:hypothetical protein
LRGRNNLLLVVAAMLIVSGLIFQYEVDREALYAQGYWTGDWSAYAKVYGPDLPARSGYDYAGSRPVWPVLLGLGAYLAAIISLFAMWWGSKR